MELSDDYPLKSLHEHLENPEYAFIGISNRSLDASKQNRCITLSKI